MGRLQVQVPDVAGLIPDLLGHALFSASGKQMAPTCCRKSARASGWSLSRAIWITPSGAAVGTAASPKYRCWRSLVFLPVPTSCSNDGAKRDCDQRRPGPTGGIMLKSATGATLIVNDTGIYFKTAAGAMVTLVGPAVTINNGALTLSFSRILKMTPAAFSCHADPQRTTKNTLRPAFTAAFAVCSC